MPRFRVLWHNKELIALLGIGYCVGLAQTRRTGDVNTLLERRENGGVQGRPVITIAATHLADMKAVRPHTG